MSNKIYEKGLLFHYSYELSIPSRLVLIDFLAILLTPVSRHLFNTNIYFIHFYIKIHIPKSGVLKFQNHSCLFFHFFFSLKETFFCFASLPMIIMTAIHYYAYLQHSKCKWPRCILSTPTYMHAQLLVVGRDRTSIILWHKLTGPQSTGDTKVRDIL